MSALIPNQGIKEVIILGRGPSRIDCPFDKECWATASVLDEPEMKIDRIHKVFAFDDDDLIESGLTIAKDRDIPIVSTKEYATLLYPMDEIIGRFGKAYFRPTASYMLAYAIFRGYQKMYLYGIDQGPDWVHLVNKPYVMFWLGVATGNGVEWELSKYSILLETMGDKIREYTVALKERIRQFKQEALIV